MTLILKATLCTSLLLLCTSLCSAGEQEQAAAAAATPWLQLVDSGQKAESWFQASSDFRGAVSKEQWVHALDTVRTPLGKLVSREPQSATFTTKLPNMHSGEYVVLLYKTSYDKAPNMVETVIMAKEKDGKWRVSGYFIKQAGE